MRRHLMTSALLALTATVVQAQTSATAPISATIVSALTISATGTTNFGSVSDVPHTEILDPIVPGQGKSTAVYAVTSAPNRTLTLSCPAGVGLTGPTAVGIAFVPRFAMSTGTQTQAQATSLGVSSCPSSTVTSPGDFKLYLGGVLNIQGTIPPGAYSGTFTLSVAY